MNRAADVIVASTALGVMAPVMVVVALAVLLTEGRPVLFRQDRAGLGGKPFMLRKFRTMTAARNADGRMLPDAQRVTRLGRLLRTTRVDELPQLISILVGDMSVIGPRPLPAAVLAFDPDRARKRNTIRPGLTGWAQVNGNARLTDRDKLALDTWYVDHRSVRLDLMIVLRTVLVIVRGENVAADAIRRAHASGPDRRG